MLGALLLNLRRIGGDDAPRKEKPKADSEYLTRGELRLLEERDAAEKAVLKRLEAEAALKTQEIEKRMVDAMRRNDEAALLLLDDELRRDIIKLWMVI